MKIKTTLFAALLLAATGDLASFPLNAEPNSSSGGVAMTAMADSQQPLETRHVAGQTERRPEGLAMAPGASGLGDIFGGRGPNPHADTVKRIAIYDSIGNLDGAAILKSELHQFGVTRQALERSTDFLKLHEDGLIGNPEHQYHGQARIEAAGEQPNSIR